MSLGIIEEERLAALGYRIVTHSESDGQGEGQWFRAKVNGGGIGPWRGSKTEAWADAIKHEADATPVVKQEAKHG